MPVSQPDPKELGYYFTLGQVGLEMVVPVGLGVLLDRWLGWMPWCTVIGAVLGLALGLIHLVQLTNRPGPPTSSGPPQETP